jgi:hypothetical protein
MYEAATRLLGFGGLEAGKTMRLAPYGTAGGHVVLPFGDAVSDGPHGNKLLSGLPADPPNPLVRQAWTSYLHDRFRPGSADGPRPTPPVVRRRLRRGTSSLTGAVPCRGN